MNREAIVDAIRDIPDFPKPGIIFKDITPLLANGELFATYIDDIAKRYPNPPDYIVGIESRGFIFGAPLAYKFRCGLVPVRKKGKLPHQTIAASYSLEYGEATMEIHRDALPPGSKVLLVDDLLATGGTAAAAVKLIRALDAEIVGAEFLIELAFLKGREKLSGVPVNALVAVP